MSDPRLTLDMKIRISCPARDLVGIVLAIDEHLHELTLAYGRVPRTCYEADTILPVVQRAALEEGGDDE